MATLPSSPPVQRTRSRSRTPSNYSLDLDALLPSEDESELLPSPSRKPHIDVVHSEDIDGPTDFTQNLEYWMTAKLPNVTRPLRMTGPARDAMEEYVAEETEVRSPDAGKAGEGAVVAETPKKASDGEGMSFISDTPFSERPEHVQDSTPTTVEHVSSATLTGTRGFQPSVEDHDDTPSRMQPSSSAIGATLRSPEFTLKSRPDYFAQGSNEDSKGDDEESETVKSLREALEKLREELDEVRRSREHDQVQIRVQFEKQAEEHQRRQEAQMQAQEREWRHRLLSTQAEHEAAMAGVRSTGDASLKDELQKVHVALATNASRVTELEAAAEARERALSMAQSQITRVEQERDAALESHKAATASQQHHDSTQASWESKCATLTSEKLSVEKRLESLQAEVANLTLEHANELDMLTARIEETANVTHHAVQEQQTTIHDLETENSRLHAQLDGKDDEIAALNEQLFSLRVEKHRVAEEQTKMAERLEKQKGLNEQAAREIQSLRAGNKILQRQVADAETVVTESSGVSELEAQLAEANSARLEADAEVDDLRSQVSTLQASVTAHQESLIVVREQFARYKEDRETMDQILDERMRKLMREREKEWARRLQEVKEEMGFRGEVLMREWGRQEVGVGEPQGYRYKFC